LFGTAIFQHLRRVMVAVWGPESEVYIGRSMTLYQDPNVVFGGMKVGGIRISHMSHIDRPHSLPLTVKRGRKNEYTVQPLAASQKDQALINAEHAAREGSEAFTAFWNTTFAKEHRAFLKDHMDKFKSLAADADEAAKPLAQRIREAPSQSEDEKGPQSESDEQWEYDYGAVEPMSNAFADGQTGYDEGASQDHAPRSDYTTWNNWIGGWRAQQEKDG